MKDTYFTFTTVYMMQGCDYLYSGCENDPLTNAYIHAWDNLAFDSRGNRLPFVLEVGMPAQDIDRENSLLEDKGKTYIRWDSRVEVTAKVFYTMDGFMEYQAKQLIEG